MREISKTTSGVDYNEDNLSDSNSEKYLYNSGGFCY